MDPDKICLYGYENSLMLENRYKTYSTNENVNVYLNFNIYGDCFHVLHINSQRHIYRYNHGDYSASRITQAKFPQDFPQEFRDVIYELFEN